MCDFVLEVSKISFSRSWRLFVTRLSLLALVTLGGLGLLLDQEWEAALAITTIGVVVAAAWTVWNRRRLPSIELTEEAILRHGKDHEEHIRWVDVSAVTMGETLVPSRTGITPVRFALVAGRGSRRIGFADLTYLDNPDLWVGAPSPTLITDVAHADVLLALVVDRLATDVAPPFPAPLLLAPAPSPEEAQTDGADAEDGSHDDATVQTTNSDQKTAAGPSLTAEGATPRRLWLGLWTIVVKLGVKAIKPLMGMLKGGKGLLAATSVGAMAVLFTWPVALALMAMLLFHEYGHVHAMKRCGIPVRGIYFIPLLGAAAVADDSWKTRRDQAYIALNGPLWGALLTAIPAGVLLLTGNAHPAVGAITALWALINLFNLLPVNPLDGGRILSAIAYSVHSTLGLVLGILTLVALVVAAAYKGFILLVFLGLVSAMELGAEIAAAQRMRRLTFSPRADEMTPDHLSRLRLLTRPGFPDSTEQRVRAVEQARQKRLATLANITAMSGKQAVRWLASYVLVVAALCAMFALVLANFPEFTTWLDFWR
jgi:Zn-dependent protease